MLLAIVIWLVWRWQPERQVRLHQRALLSALEHKNWGKLDDLMDAQYADRWFPDKATASSAAQAVFSSFLSISMTSEDDMVSLNGDNGEVAAHIRVVGGGGPIADEVKLRVNPLHEPFTFKWVHRSGKPWDWKLIRVDQPELQIGKFEF